MRQVLINLISNSVKYSKASSSIKVEAFTKDSTLYFMVENKLIQNKAEQKIESVGFGLEIVRDILILHESELILDSNEISFKACFKLEL